MKKVILIFTILFYCSGWMWSQSECPSILTLSTCTHDVLNPNQPFKCIDATQNQDLTYWTGIGKMLSYASSQFAPQFLIIKGYLRILPDPLGITSEYTFAPGSEIIFVDNSSGIEVKSGATLSLVNAYLHGCQQMWNYIRTDQNACIKAVGIQGGNTVIEDGYRALWGWGNGSRIRATDCVFRRNFISILFGEPAFPNPTQTYSDGISGNTFWGDEVMLTNPWLGTRSLIGVGIEQITNTIKVGEAGSNTNYFKDFDFSFARCINAYNSNLIVENSQFTRSSLPGDQTGILLGSSTGTHLARITGLNDGLTNPTFKNFERAIGIDNANMDITGVNCLENRLDIVQFYGIPGSSGSLFPLSTKIKDSKFTDYDKSSIFINGNLDASQNTIPVL